MEGLARRFPAGIEYEIPFDTTRFVEVSIEEVIKTLVEAMLLVFLVVYLFLQSFRATLIPMIAVPVSLIGTFAGMYALGFSINTLTLFGLVLAIGIVVDDAIVVLENTERIMRDRGQERPRGGLPVDARGDRAGGRDRAGALLGVRAGRLPRRPRRPALPPVRDHRRDLGRDLGPRRAHPVAGALRPGAARAPRAARLLPRFNRGFEKATERLRAAWCGSCCAGRCSARCSSWW